MSKVKVDYRPYFKYTSVPGGKEATCLTCQSNSRASQKPIPMADHNTAGLKKHLKSHHKRIYDKLFNSEQYASQPTLQACLEVSTKTFIN